MRPPRTRLKYPPRYTLWRPSRTARHTLNGVVRRLNVLGHKANPCVSGVQGDPPPPRELVPARVPLSGSLSRVCRGFCVLGGVGGGC